ncbi:prepilin peptidase [Lactobacillus sp.]|uniref:prepilin peptidase n=1 Tax=Lactobacillus sp. TaxID=1591 RepID=UPI0019A942B4|nr:prepilin peptidase [Lactobacillus sp.]MBD5429822.1 prepilin peptidase [Lactobacillus sp.]
MEIITLILNFIIGSCLGSHALVLVQRLDNTNFIYGSSYCDTCHIKLSLLDEIPIYSFIHNKGKCKFCHATIPIITIISEIFGGFAFLKITFYERFDILNILFIFYLLVISLQDYQEKEFSTVFIIPLTLITFLSPISSYHRFILTEWVTLLFISFFFIIQILKKKMGLGDLIIFILLALYLGTLIAVHILLIGCILLLIYYVFNHTSSSLPFIPFIFCGFIINSLF